MIEIIKADLLEAPCDIIAESNNCFCTHGSGLALAIAQKWPEVVDADCETKKGDKSKLGTTNFVSLDSDSRIKTCVLLYSQYKYGTDKRQVDYESLYRCLEELRGRITNTKLVLGLPYKLSSDRAGGDWNVVLAMINSVFGKSPMTVLICKKD